jgi:D-alanyl-D-alanine carboxypeptidase
MITSKTAISGGTRTVTALLIVLVLVTASVFLSSCGAKSFDPALVKQMDGIIRTAKVAQNLPGVVVGVWVPGRGEYTRAVGKADIKTGEPIELTDRLRIASNTKSLTATVILQLVDEGRISLDDKLDKYISGVPNGNEITIRQVLQMTGGIYNFTEDATFEAEFEKNPLMKLTPQQEVDIALQHQPYYAPGQGYHYSDTDYEMLGMIVEKVTGRKIEEEVTRRIITPLGLKDTVFPTSPDIAGPHSRGYVDKDGQLVDYTGVDPSVPWAGGAMISNLYDMKTWARALATGELLREETHKEQLTFIDTGVGKTQYGLGVVNLDGFIGHTGAIFGFSSTFFYLPEEDATVVVWTNSCTNESMQAPGILIELIKAVFPDKVS